MNSNEYQDDEISLKEIILKVKEYYLECKRNWLIILLFTLPFVGYQLYLRFTKPAYYPASLTFMVNDTKGSSLGGILGSLGGLAGEKEDKLDRILELAKTRRTMSAALFQKGNVGGKMDFYANHLIRIEGIHKGWEGDSSLAGFIFRRGVSDSFTLQENRALRQVHQTLIGGEGNPGLFSTRSEKKSGIMYFTLTTQSEQLTIAFIKELYNSLSNFYIESAVRKEKETYAVLSAKRDSISKLLFRNDISTAEHDDQSNSLILQLDKVPAKRFTRNNAILTTMYGEIIKNTELAEMALKTATPYITAIDDPIPPIKPVRQGRLKKLAMFFMLGLSLGVVFVIFRNTVRGALKA